MVVVGVGGVVGGVVVVVVGVVAVVLTPTHLRTQHTDPSTINLVLHVRSSRQVSEQDCHAQIGSPSGSHPLGETLLVSRGQSHF